MSHDRVINMLNIFAKEALDTANTLDRIAARGGLNREIATRVAAETRQIAESYKAAADALTTDTVEAP